MKPEQIKIGRTYIGGKHNDRRTVVKWGADERHVCWAPSHERLPLGGFVRTRCTTTAGFARWAVSIEETDHD